MGGEARILYRLSVHDFRIPGGMVVVSLSFQRPRHVCRFEKGGWCKEAKLKCAPESCPLTFKTK